MHATPRAQTSPTWQQTSKFEIKPMKYTQQEIAAINKLELKRRLCLQKFTICAVACAVYILVFFCSIIPRNEYTASVFFAIIFFIGFLITLFYSQSRVSDKEESMLFAKVISKMWGKKIKYSSELGYTAQQISDTSLFKYFERKSNIINPAFQFFSSDRAEMTWNNISFTVSDIRIFYGSSEIQIASKNNFKGVMIKANFPFDFEGETWVQPRLGKYTTRPGEIVTLESSEFNQIYRTYTTDQMGARMALQTDIMAALVDLNTMMLKKPIRLAFIKNEVWIAFETESGWLDINLFTNIYTQLEYTQCLLEKISSIMLNIKLNVAGNRLVNLK
jgi:hypothetical protein